MSMNGIDVSSNQPANICKLVPYDFAIVKATGNPPNYAWNYKNPLMKQQVDDALNKTGCAGLYHFTYGRDANEEADLFTNHVKDYVGRVILVIDYEDKAVDNGREWLRTFIKRVKANTDVNPMVYASSSVIKSQKLVELCKEENCGIWSANYYAGYKAINGYTTDGLRMDIAESVIWQYTSSGHLPGYSGALDLDIFYGDKEAWLKYAKGDGNVKPSTPSQTPSGYDADIAGLQEECNAQGFSNQKIDGIAGSVTLAGCPTVRKGASGGISAWIQRRLLKLGYGLPEYGADGKFGSETKDAVRAFQRDHGLKDDGVVGYNTWRKLLGL